LPPQGYPVFGLNIDGAAANTSGKALDWFMESIGPPGAAFATLEDEHAGAPPGCDGLLFLPHLAGERAPQHDRPSRGAWVGLTLGHTRQHLVRSVLEGVAFEFRVMQDSLEALGAEIGEVRCVGGQARSALWNQIRADVLNRPVLVPESVEAAVVGGAIFAALGVGAFANLDQATTAMVRISGQFQPDAARAVLYRRQFENYKHASAAYSR
jgi:sugar (pentulose or hexulose) kinase